VREQNPFEDITEESSADKRACFLTITKEGQIQYKSPKSVATQTDVDEMKKELANKKHVIKIGNGLSLIDSTTGESASAINLFNDDSVWELSLQSSEGQTMASSTGFNPWELDHKGTYIYTGNCGFSNGVLVTTEEYEEDYQYTKNQ
jgi:hypothetical protein